MVDAHIQSFFGHNTGIIVKTLSRSKPYILFRFIKKKPSGVWEKPSINEGKLIKFSLEEIIMILQVLNRNILNWTNYHTYQNKKKHISFNWEENSTEILWINIDDYSKMLNFAQIEILRLLMTHILNEKIIYATSSKRKFKGISSELENESYISDETENYNLKIEESRHYNFKKEIPIMTSIQGLIKGESNKAILIEFGANKEIWIPKSTIHSQYIPKKCNQTFLIENWILEKNKIKS
ncbi:MAG: hypothetical protein ACFFBY_09345 [Promethearchaeota archaeon]